MGTSVRPTGFEDLIPAQGKIAPSSGRTGFEDLIPRRGSTGDINLRTPADKARNTSPPPPTEKPGLGEQILSGGKDFLEAVTHPLDTVKGMLHGVAESGRQAGAPVIGRTAGMDLVSQREIADIEHQLGRPLPKVTKDTPGAVTPTESLKGIGNTVANVGFLMAPELALPARLAVNAGLGAANNPDQPIRGAVGGALLGEGLHGVTKTLPEYLHGGEVGAEAAKPTDAAGVKEAFLAQLTPEEQAHAKADPLYHSVFGEAPQHGPDMSVAGETGQVRRRLGKPPAKPVEPGPDAATVSAGGTEPDALDKLIATRQYLEPRGQLEPVDQTVGRRPLESLPIDQRPPVEPGPEVQPYSTKSGNVLRRPGGAKPVEPPIEPTATPEPDQPIIGPERPLKPYSTPELDANRLQPVATANPEKALVRPDAQRRANKDAGPARRLLTGKELGGPEVPTPELRERARLHAYENFRGNTYQNVETDKAITMNRRGIDHTLTHAADDVAGRIHAQSIPALDQLLEDATQVGTEAPKAGVSRGTVAVHRFEKPITIDGESYTAHLVVKESPDGHFFYDHKLTTIEPGEPSSVPFHQSQDGGDASGPSGSTAEAQLRPPAPVTVPTLPDRELSPTANPTVSEGSGPAGGERLTETQLRPRNLPSGEPTGNIEPQASPSDLLNVAKLNLNKTAEQRVADQLEQFRSMREEQKQTFAEADVNRKAIINELLANDPKALAPAAAARLSGEELLARRDVVNQNDKLISDLSKSIESGQLRPAEHEQATQLLQKAVEHNDALLSDLVTGSSQKGRDLNLLRRMANTSLDPDVWLVQAKRMLGDTPMTDEVMSNVRRLVKAAQEACGG